MLLRAELEALRREQASTVKSNRVHSSEANPSIAQLAKQIEQLAGNLAEEKEARIKLESRLAQCTCEQKRARKDAVPDEVPRASPKHPGGR